MSFITNNVYDNVVQFPAGVNMVSFERMGLERVVWWGKGGFVRRALDSGCVPSVV